MNEKEDFTEYERSVLEAYKAILLNLIEFNEDVLQLSENELKRLKQLIVRSINSDIDFLEDNPETYFDLYLSQYGEEKPDFNSGFGELDWTKLTKNRQSLTDHIHWKKLELKNEKEETTDTNRKTFTQKEWDDAFDNAFVNTETKNTNTNSVSNEMKVDFPSNPPGKERTKEEHDRMIEELKKIGTNEKNNKQRNNLLPILLSVSVIMSVVVGFALSSYKYFGYHNGEKLPIPEDVFNRAKYGVDKEYSYNYLLAISTLVISAATSYLVSIKKK